MDIVLKFAIRITKTLEGGTAGLPTHVNMSRIDLNQIQAQLKVAIQSHQVVFANFYLHPFQSMIHHVVDGVDSFPCDVYNAFRQTLCLFSGCRLGWN